MPKKTTKTTSTSLPDWVPGFLEALVADGDVQIAARKVHRDRSAVYSLRRRSPEFRGLIQRARDRRTASIRSRAEEAVASPA
jgi:hypothetical protein